MLLLTSLAFPVLVSAQTEGSGLDAPETEPHFEATTRAPRHGPAEPAPASTSQTHLRQSDVETLAPRTAEDILRLVPGLTLVQHGNEGKGQQFFLRGFDALHGADFEVSYDGIPLNEWSGIHAQGYLDLGIVIPETIQDISVDKGALLASQGPFAIAGSASFRSGIDCHRRGTQARAEAGSTLRARGAVVHSPEDCTNPAFLALEGVHDQGYGQAREVSRGTLNARSPYFQAGGWSTGASAAGAIARAELPGPIRFDDENEGRIGFYDAYSLNAFARSERVLGRLTAEHQTDTRRINLSLWSSWRHLELFENFTGYLLNPVDGDWRLQQETSTSGGLRFRVLQELHTAHTLVLAQSLLAQRLNQQQYATDQEQRRLQSQRDLNGRQIHSGSVLHWRWAPVGSVSLDTAFRLDAFAVSANDEPSASRGQGIVAQLSPRTLLTIEPSRQWRATLGYGQGVRPPEARSFTRALTLETGISDEAARNQPATTRSHSSEAGVQFRPITALAVHAVGFATWIARESLFDHVSGTSLELGPTRRAGAELTASWTLGPVLAIDGNITFADARFVESGNRVPLAPKAVASGRLRTEHHSGFIASAQFLWFAPRTLPNGATGAAYVGLDITAGYQRPAWSVRAVVENVLNRELRQGEYNFGSNWQPSRPASRLPEIHTFAGPPLNGRLIFTWTP